MMRESTVKAQITTTMSPLPPYRLPCYVIHFLRILSMTTVIIWAFIAFTLRQNSYNYMCIYFQLFFTVLTKLTYKHSVFQRIWTPSFCCAVRHCCIRWFGNKFATIRELMFLLSCKGTRPLKYTWIVNKRS